MKLFKRIRGDIFRALFFLCLLFTAFYSVSVNAEESAVSEDASNEHGSKPFIMDDSGEKVYLTGDMLSEDMSQNEILKNKMIQMKKDYQAANNVTKDVRGWIYLKDYLYLPFTDVPEQFDKYFRANIYGAFDWAGLPMMSATSMSTLDGNSLIYGHNMNNGTAFGNLRYIDTDENFKNARALIVYDGQTDQFYLHKFYTSIVIRDGAEFIKLKNFDNDEERVAYNKSLAERNRQSLEDGVDIDYSNPIVFLQLCLENSYDRDLRRVLGFSRYATIDAKALEENRLNGDVFEFSEVEHSNEDSKGE